MKQIFEEAALCNLKLNNRLIRSATWEGIADNDGSITEDSYEIYEEFAQGGVGAIITGFTSVAANDHYFGGMMRLSSDSLIPQYKKLTDIIHKYDCPVIAVGGFRSVDTMESVLKKTEISFISLSRPLLREPDLPEKMKKNPQMVSKCVSCNACYSSIAHKCIFRGRNMA